MYASNKTNGRKYENISKFMEAFGGSGLQLILLKFYFNDPGFEAQVY